jgi:hypothetical protein
VRIAKRFHNPKPDMPPKPPQGLGKRGRSLWKRVVAEYKLRPDEVDILTEACHTLDLIQRLQDELHAVDLLTLGSKKQERVTVVATEIRQQLLVLNQLLAKLKLPDEPGATPDARGMERSVSARQAALRGGANPANWRS